MRSAHLVWIVSTASLFAFLSVFWWALQRRREREAFYRHEIARRMIERGEEAVERALGWLADQEAEERRSRRVGLRLGALVTIGAGAGALIGLGELTGDDSIPAWVSILIGVALLLHLALSRRTGPGG